MFKWLYSRKSEKDESHVDQIFVDDIEKSLWEIKEEYDLETEEVLKTVDSKRKNLLYMRQAIKNKS